LSQLVDAALQELLIGAQICELVGAGCRKTSEQRNCSGQAADRRHAADVPLSNHCSPEKSKVAIGRTESPVRFSPHNMQVGVLIKRALRITWCFRRSVAMLQHIDLSF
jgi:hypothetical protein